jgi:hypothetical protein
LILLAAIFGIGAVLEGILWAGLIGLVFLGAAIVYFARLFSEGNTESRTARGRS